MLLLLYPAWADATPTPTPTPAPTVDTGGGGSSGRVRGPAFAEERRLFNLMLARRDDADMVEIGKQFLAMVHGKDRLLH